MEQFLLLFYLVKFIFFTLRQAQGERNWKIPLMVILSLTKNRTTLRQAQGERLFPVHAEPDEARQAQCERKISTYFHTAT